jgi:hypothetical protein
MVDKTSIKTSRDQSTAQPVVQPAVHAGAKDSGVETFTKRVQRTFLMICRHLFNGKVIFLSREHMFGKYSSIVFKFAKKSPLLQLIKEINIAELKSIEIITKDGPDQYISNTDIESIIMTIREKSETLFIIVSDKHILEEKIDRLFREFAENQVLILLIEEDDVSRFEHWIHEDNINACLLTLTLLARKIANMGDSDKRSEIIINRLQKSFIEERIDKVGGISSNQIRTLVKKLSFIMSFVRTGGEIKENCEYIGISRKTFYNWMNEDSVFRNIIEGDLVTSLKEEFPEWYDTDEFSDNQETWEIDEITHETI